MKKNLFDTNSLLLALFFCCLIYVLDVYVDVYVFKEGNVVQQFFFPENFELYFRGLISLVFIVFGLITSRVIQKLKLQEAALNKTQQELTESKEEAEEATLLKDKFLSLVAHDLQAPSSVVANLIHLILKDKGDPICREHREILAAALESCNKMKVFVKDVLTVCRIKSGKIKPLARFDYLGLFITKAVNTYVKIAEKKGITVINNVPNEKRVYADFVLLSQVIENLLFNALKYSSRGDSVTFYIPEDDPTTFAVKDTGVGIVSTILPTIFSYDVAKSTKGTAGEIGTGLGLPLCRDLLLAHGGDLTVASKKGEGSIFYAKLPYCKPIIMIVDDEKSFRTEQKKHFEKMKTDIIEAENGEQALHQIKAKTPHLIVTDINMPGMDGFEFLDNLKGNPETNPIPVIVVSAFTELKLKNEAFKKGAADFVQKPFEPEEFIPRVMRFVG